MMLSKSFRVLAARCTYLETNMRWKISLSLGLTALALAPAAAQAPADPLRVVWLQGNPVQARVKANGQAEGPAIDLAEEIGRRLHRPITVTGISTTAGVLKSLRDGAADLAFIGYDPERSEGLTFTPPYLLSLNRYAVRLSSKTRANGQVDRSGVKLGAIATDSGGLFLKRTIRKAALVPVPSVDVGLAKLEAGEVDVMAGAAQRLADLANPKAVRVLPGYFYAVPQSIAVREGDAAKLEVASAAVRDALRSGLVAKSIAKWGLSGAAAPAPLVPGK